MFFFRAIKFSLHKIRQYGFSIITERIKKMFIEKTKVDNFDSNYGVETEGDIHLYRLTIDGPNYLYGAGYKASPEEIVEAAIRKLPIKCDDFSFVDLGAGKGRTLFIAARFPFKRIIGVEFAKELVEIAKRNIKKFGSDRIEVIHCDALKYDFPSGDLVIYMYNPFERFLLEKVMERISDFSKSNTVYLIYLQLQDVDVVSRYATEIFDSGWIRLYKVRSSSK